MDKLKTVLFCSVLAIFFVLFLVLPKSDYAGDERRYLAEPPEVAVSKIADGTFSTQCEDYLADHFPGRKFFVGVYHSFQNLMGNNGESGIYRGQDDFLFSLPERDTAKLDFNLNAVKAFTENLGVDGTLMAVPAAGSVLTEQLPKNHLAYRDEAIFGEVTAKLSPSVTVIPLFADFTAVKDKTELYFRTDHHWTTAGAYEGYRAFCAEKGITPLAEADFRKEDFPGFYGTLYARSGLWSTPADTLTLWHPPYPLQVEIRDDDKSETVTADSPFFTDAFAGPDPYNIFFNGNHSLIRITDNAVADGKLLVVKDSYANALVPFLAAHYHEICMVDLRYFRKEVLSEFARDEGITEVLYVYGLSQLMTDDNLIWLK